MEIYTLKRRIGSDGMLRLELQLDVEDNEVEVVIVVNAVAKSGSDSRSSMERAKAQYACAYEPWTYDEERELLAMVKAGRSTKEIVQALERQPGAIRSRLEKIELRNARGV